MFIAIVKYKKPLEEVDRFLQAHRDFLNRHYAAGDIITSGPQTPRVGGVYMFRAETRQAAETLISQDPFYIHEIAEYELVEFTPTLFCDPALSQFLK